MTFVRDLTGIDVEVEVTDYRTDFGVNLDGLRCLPANEEECCEMANDSCGDAESHEELHENIARFRRSALQNL